MIENEEVLFLDLGLKNKIAVITGGSIGIGYAVAQAFAQEGVHVALCAREKKEQREAAQALQNRYGIKAIGVRADVSKAEDIDNFVKR